MIFGLNKGTHLFSFLRVVIAISTASKYFQSTLPPFMRRNTNYDVAISDILLVVYSLIYYAIKILVITILILPIS